MLKISKENARRVALYSQGLDGRWNSSQGKEGAAQTIERLGYVQIDTISVVQRAHHHALWSRQPDYRPHMLHELLAQDRRVFEWWTHAASYIPTRDYRYYLQRMRRTAQRPRAREWRQQNAELIAHVMNRIRAEGPLGSADFEAPEGFKRGTWWSRKPAKQALEWLFNSGELMISERKHFQRIYDLRERVLPPGTDLTEPGADEMQRFIVHRSLGSLGLAPQNGIKWGRQAVAPETLQELVDTGQVTSLEIEGIEGETVYALSETLDEAMVQEARRTQLHILSPFDNLVIHRRWLESLFDFQYSLEAYTPAAKRQYGYFCLPILWGEQFVGRMDSKADRKARTFVVRRLILEPEWHDRDEMLPALAGKLNAFATFNGCESILVEETDPYPLKEALESELGIKAKS
jgi:uncharacterized protein YcaQ